MEKGVTLKDVEQLFEEIHGNESWKILNVYLFGSRFFTRAVFTSSCSLHFRQEEVHRHP